MGNKKVSRNSESVKYISIWSQSSTAVYKKKFKNSIMNLKQSVHCNDIANVLRHIWSASKWFLRRGAI